MKTFLFPDDIQTLPRPADADAARRGIERWTERAEHGNDAEMRVLAAAIIASPTARALLETLAGNSPFLSETAFAHPETFAALLHDGPDRAFDAVLTRLDREAAEAASLDADEAFKMLSRVLRQAKARAALIIAAADIADAWPLEKVTGALSTLADRTIALSVEQLLRAAATRGELDLVDLNHPTKDSGFIVLGLGKLGGRELNYSSDVDLFLLFDDEKVRYRGRQSPQQFFVKLSHSLIALLHERTEHGYVFRTDLRLRPDPGATPPVVSVLAAEMYYESMGQNWERAALIKARPVAGDRTSAEAFIAHLRPFLWRKNLDFAAIQDIHSIKRQINAHRGGAAVRVGGHNVKLGRGGIREIEFFAQTQQLIWGGREPNLRASSTLAALEVLVTAGRVTREGADELNTAYHFLRRVEHRLQMIDDRQTHTVPETSDGLRHIALFLGYADSEAFAAALTAQLTTVERHYAALFEESAPLAAPEGNLVFTGTEDDPETLKTLVRLGYKDGHAVSAVVRGWHHGRYRATRSARAREILTELMPRLLGALAKTANADTAFVNFDAFLKQLPAGVQLFSLFHANPELLDLVATVMGMAPRLAAYLAANPALLDGVLAGGFFQPPPNADELARELDLMFIYDATPGAERSDGAKSLAVSQYYARLGQRLISALTVPTSEGTLFSVDVRLRPSGNAGPLAASFDAFTRYHRESAWTWEHMALTRARVVAGDDGLNDRVTTAIGALIAQPRDAGKLLGDVADMRHRVREAHPGLSPWDVKYRVGGLVDVEFIAQYLILASAAAHPDVVSGATAVVYDRLAAVKAIEPDAAVTLRDAGRLWRTIQGLLRLTVEGPFEESEAPEGLKAVLAHATGAKDFAALRAAMEETAANVTRLYDALIERPATATTAKSRPS